MFKYLIHHLKRLFVRFVGWCNLLWNYQTVALDILYWWKIWLFFWDKTVFKWSYIFRDVLYYKEYAPMKELYATYEYSISQILVITLCIKYHNVHCFPGLWNPKILQDFSDNTNSLSYQRSVFFCFLLVTRGRSHLLRLHLLYTHRSASETKTVRVLCVCVPCPHLKIFLPATYTNIFLKFYKNIYKMNLFEIKFQWNYLKGYIYWIEITISNS